MLHQKLDRSVRILSTENQLKRLYELVESNKNLIAYKLADEDCIRIQPYMRGDMEVLDRVEEEVRTRHHDLSSQRGRDCLRVCLRPPFSRVMSDSIYKHMYASMED